MKDNAATEQDSSVVDIVVFFLNTIGFVGYLIWLVSGSQRIFYTQEGVLYLLPCLPFFFVYVFLYRRKNPLDEGEDEVDDDKHPDSKQTEEE